MGVAIESLFTAALGLQAPWPVESVDLSSAKSRIDFELRCKAKTLTGPHCGAADQGIHHRVRRQWRHLDFSQFEALALTMCQGLPVRQAARIRRARPRPHAGAGVRRGLERPRRHAHRHRACLHGHECGVPQRRRSVPAQRADERRAVCHIVKLAGEAMDEVRSAEWKDESERVRQALGDLTPQQRRSIIWGLRRNPQSCSNTQPGAMHWLQCAKLKTARAWRLKMGLCEVFAKARGHNDAALASADLKRWISWARHSRLDSFKRLGARFRMHFDAAVRGMLDHRSNAFVEAMNGLMQHAKRAARGFRTAANFIAIAYLRLGRAHAPANLSVRASIAAVGGGHHTEGLMSRSTGNGIEPWVRALCTARAALWLPGLL